MGQLKSIVERKTTEYGSIKVKLAEVLDARNISRNALSSAMGSKYDTVTRYYEAKDIQMLDLNFFAKVCCVLDCRIEDLLEYEPPKETPVNQEQK